MNEIVFISHDSYSTADISNIDYIFFIDKADEDDFNVQPIQSSASLYEILNNAKYKKKASNLQFIKQKQEQKAKKRKMLQNKIKRKLDKIVPKKIYIHEKQC